MKNTDLLFVYGTLRRTPEGGVHALLKGNAEFLEGARFHGVLYDVGDYPGAIFSPRCSDVVLGEVYAIKRSQQLLKALDEYEECAATFAKPTEYQRVIAPVTCISGAEVMAWIYLFNRPVDGYRRIECGDYLHFKIAYERDKTDLSPIT